MSRLPPDPSSAPAIGNGHLDIASPSQQKTKWERGSRSASYSTFPDEDSEKALDPDELFSKHAVAEVKFMQHRLRADADAKQEELRLMVGERYRDLLQASTSIISLSKSAQRVNKAIQETRAEIVSQKAPQLRLIQPSGSDIHLNTLQLLSAHMKLLLDTPEHLWRLIERQKYLSAAWLFLLARVVYRALVRQDDQDEQSWARLGIDVLGQFPLIRRQWDAISQFRHQIVRKATLSLSEDSSSIEDVCATLLTLHLLDSQPLVETLSAFLGQRLKTLKSKLSNNSELPSSLRRRSNGQADTQFTPEASLSDQRGKAVNDIKQVFRAALDTISQTIKAARTIFQEEESSPSLIRRVLQYIQSDAPTTQPTHNHTLPTELYLTTQSLLATLPSSMHFQLLPLNLRSYKPHVDLTSPSTRIDPGQFRQRINEWFRDATSVFQPAIERRSRELQTVKAVWSVRSLTREWILGSCLDKEELTKMMSVLDEVSRSRIHEIWKLCLDESLRTFGDVLDSSLASLNSDTPTRKHSSQAHLLFQSPPLPATTHSSLNSINVSFQKYKTSLRKQIIGRTSLLDDVLTTLESCARTIRQDLTHVMSTGDDTRILVEQLENNYKHDANTLCTDVADRLEQHTESPSSNPLSTNALVFLGHVANELASSSSFISEIGCENAVAEAFRARTATVHDMIIDRWRTETISRIVTEHYSKRRLPHATAIKSLPSTPSPNLIKSLLSLSTALREKGTSYHQSQDHFVQTTLEQFTSVLIGDGWTEHGPQSLYDLVFLQELLDLSGAGREDTKVSSALQGKIGEESPPGVNEEDLRKAATESIIRMQNLFATLLPQPPPIPSSNGAEKPSHLLPYGQPSSSDLQFQPALELAKPTPRFGLLLVS